MPDQFVVPQFIDAEDKIIGPVTARQFVVMMVTILVDLTFYRLFSFALFLALGIPLLAFGAIVAFVKINGQPFHYFILNLIQTIQKPRLRIWHKDYPDRLLKDLMKAPPPPPAPPPRRKELVSGSRLQELSLVVNTGGVYQPDEESDF